MNHKCLRLAIVIFSVLCSMVCLLLIGFQIRTIMMLDADIILTRNYFKSNELDAIPDNKTKILNIKNTNFNSFDRLVIWIGYPRDVIKEDVFIPEIDRNALQPIYASLEGDAILQSDDKIVDSCSFQLLHTVSTRNKSYLGQPIGVLHLNHELPPSEINIRLSGLPNFTTNQRRVLRVTAIMSPLNTISFIKEILLIIFYLFLTRFLFKTIGHQLHVLKHTKIAGRVGYLVTAYPVKNETLLRQDLDLLLKSQIDLYPLSLMAGDTSNQEGWPKMEVLMPEISGVETNVVYLRLKSLLKKIISIFPEGMRLYFLTFNKRTLYHRLRREVNKLQLAHIHAEFDGLAAVFAYLVAKDLGISLSFDIQNADQGLEAYPIKSMLNYSSAVIASNYAASRFSKHYCNDSEEKIHLLPHGLIMDEWSFREAPMEKLEKLKLVFIGEMIERKGLDYLLEGLALARKEEMSVTLTIIGSGEHLTDYQDKAKELKLDSCITWKGQLDHEKIHDEIFQADVVCSFTIPKSDDEFVNVPNVMIEAMACGVPVIGNHPGSISEIFNVNTGIVIQQLTPRNLVNAFKTVMSTPKDIERRRQKARQIINTHFDALELTAKRREVLLDAISE